MDTIAADAPRSLMAAPKPTQPSTTGRAAFTAALEALLPQPGRALPGPALLLIDLDRFKHVNDAHGHRAGDAVLSLVAARLAKFIRAQDQLFALGADEFAVLSPDPDAPEAMGARLLEMLGRPYLVEGRACHVSASIGCAVAPMDAATAKDLLQAADLALDLAKQDGGNTLRRFRPDLSRHAKHRHVLERDIRRALALGQLVLHYQAQVNLRSRQLIGFEALLRWQHPTLGLVPPDQFIGIAEETGLIIPIGEWVLRSACRQAALWPDPVGVAVNVSAIQLREPARLITAVASALRQAGLRPERLEVEITESSLIRHQVQTREVLDALRAFGVRVSMDDFGTGYSSLSQLRSFPFDKIKIDRSFVRDVTECAEAAGVVRAIAALGRSLGMNITAEGVETDNHADFVEAGGCTDMQGYLVSRPVPAEALPKLIDALEQSFATRAPDLP